MEAQVTYGIQRLAARIHELRRAGFKIKTEHRRDEMSKAYARYILPMAA